MSLKFKQKHRDTNRPSHKSKSYTDTRRKSYANVGLSSVRDDYATTIDNMSRKSQRVKNITIESSK